MELGTPDTIREAERLIATHRPWYHRIEIAPGVVTPGTHGSSHSLAVLDRIGLPHDLTGVRALDVGCRDGFFSFELEHRGAEVLAIDSVAVEETGFEIARELLGCTTPFHTRNVYDLSPEREGKFGLVLFLGVLYHLRHPLLALDRLRAVCAPDATMFLATEALLETEEEAAYVRYYVRDSFRKGGTTKWVPNQTALVDLLTDAQFEVEELRMDGSRALLRARAVDDPSVAYWQDIDASGIVP
jgi:tRNA (mo5U34)-methyltransferase